MITDKQLDYILYLMCKDTYYGRLENEQYLRKMTCKEASEYIQALLNDKKKSEEYKKQKENAKNDVKVFESDDEKLEIIKLFENNDLDDLYDILYDNQDLAKKLYNINIFKNELDKKINDVFTKEYDRDLESYVENFIY